MEQRMAKAVLGATRYHDFSAGHRVVGHESKCAFLHGHNYRVHFTCAGALDSVGRVIDFGVIKSRLSMWLEENWDHKFLAWEDDAEVKAIMDMSPGEKFCWMFQSSIVWTPFNPTAENMARYLLLRVGPEQLAGTDVVLTRVVIDETRKCSAEASLP